MALAAAPKAESSAKTKTSQPQKGKVEKKASEKDDRKVPLKKTKHRSPSISSSSSSSSSDSESNSSSSSEEEKKESSSSDDSENS